MNQPPDPCGSRGLGPAGRGQEFAGGMRDNDRGSTLLLTIFFGALALAVVLMVIAATSLYLERKRLFTLADGAALAGAEAFDIRNVLLADGSPRVLLTDDEVSDAVAVYLDGNPVRSLEGLTVESAGSPDGTSATVRLSAYWRPPVVSLLVPDGFRMEVATAARSVFSPVP